MSYLSIHSCWEYSHISVVWAILLLNDSVVIKYSCIIAGAHSCVR
jgi:hypothetical protein